MVNSKNPGLLRIDQMFKDHIILAEDCRKSCWPEIIKAADLMIFAALNRRPVLAFGDGADHLINDLIIINSKPIKAIVVNEKKQIAAYSEQYGVAIGIGQNTEWLREACINKMKTVAIIGKFSAIFNPDVVIKIISQDQSRIQEMNVLICHALCDYVTEQLK